MSSAPPEDPGIPEGCVYIPKQLPAEEIGVALDREILYHLPLSAENIVAFRRALLNIDPKELPTLPEAVQETLDRFPASLDSIPRRQLEGELAAKLKQHNRLVQLAVIHISKAAQLEDGTERTALIQEVRYMARGILSEYMTEFEDDPSERPSANRGESFRVEEMRTLLQPLAVFPRDVREGLQASEAWNTSSESLERALSDAGLQE